MLAHRWDQYNSQYGTKENNRINCLECHLQAIVHILMVSRQRLLGEHERTLTQPAASRTLMKGAVQQHTCTCFCATTWICSPHFVFPFSHPGNPYLHVLCGRYSAYVSSEETRFSSSFFLFKLCFLITTLNWFCFSPLFKPRLFAKWSLKSWSTLVLVVMTCVSDMFSAAFLLVQIAPSELSVLLS